MKEKKPYIKKTCENVRTIEICARKRISSSPPDITFKICRPGRKFQKWRTYITETDRIIPKIRSILYCFVIVSRTRCLTIGLLDSLLTREETFVVQIQDFSHLFVLKVMDFVQDMRTFRTVDFFSLEGDIHRKTDIHPPLEDTDQTLDLEEEVEEEG